MMKKFIKVFVCLCLCVVSMALVACGKESKIDAPDKNAPVSSNGGAVVQKGDYLYFANGYVSVDDVTKSDLGKSYNIGGLFVTKTNINGDIQFTDKGNLKSKEKLTGKLSGFEATELFISGNYMYFTTINTEETKKGGLQTSHLEVYRINLDSTDCKRVYRSGVDFEDSEGNRVVTFDYFESNGNVYLLINEKGSLKRIVCNGGIGGTTTIKTGVKSVAHDESTNSIFFTTVNDGLYEINRYDIVQNKITNKLICSQDDTIGNLFAVKFNHLYLYASLNGGSEYLYKISFEDVENNTVSFTKLTATTYNAIYLLENEEDGILLISSSRVEIADYRNPLTTITPMSNMDTSATIMTVKGGYVYYYSNNTISRWNYTNQEVEVIGSEIESICNYHFDIVGNYIYYYATTGSNDYLYRINFAEHAPETKPQLIGTYTAEDAPKTEDEE